MAEKSGRIMDRVYTERYKLHLSREERDYIAGHALDSVQKQSEELIYFVEPKAKGDYSSNASDCARKVAALSNLLGDIGWEREAAPTTRGELSAGECKQWFLGELFPVAQLRPWLEEWQRQDDQALLEVEKARSALQREGYGDGGGGLIEADVLRDIETAQTKLGTGAILLARIEKWMASHEN